MPILDDVLPGARRKPSGICPAEEICAEQKITERRHRGGEETELHIATMAEGKAMQKPQYINCKHPFRFRNVEAVRM